MGCLNSTGNFNHWFGNIHFSGPCNRSCYFCVGQHMMALDPYNNLKKWPLDNYDTFLEKCKEKKVSEVFLTGSNTDPLLYEYLPLLCDSLRKELGVEVGIRTNGALILARPLHWQLFDKGSISIPSFDETIYKKMMGSGKPPDLEKILIRRPLKDIKINIVLGPENVESKDVLASLDYIATLPIRRVNLREPYGQPRISDPMQKWGFKQVGTRYGMPYYNYAGVVDVMYWDVHYVEVESVNLYANGQISMDYPITRGHDPENGKVLPQSHFKQSGRQNDQWIFYKMKAGIYKE